MLSFVLAALILALDQLFKQYIVRTLEIGETGPVIIPGVLGLTRLENDGAMLNILSGQQWLLAAIAFVAAVILVMILLRYNEGFLGTLGLSMALGGTLGNLFDRVFNDGSVVDMFRTLFVNFPIFNIADIFITLGLGLFLVHFIILTIKTGADTEESDPAVSSLAAIDDKQLIAEISETVDPSSMQSEALESDIVTEATPAHADPVTALQDNSPVTPTATVPEATTIPAATDSDVGFSLEDLEAELSTIDDDNYDINDLLREYGSDSDDLN